MAGDYIIFPTVLVDKATQSLTNKFKEITLDLRHNHILEGFSGVHLPAEQFHETFAMEDMTHLCAALGSRARRRHARP